jgi:phenylpropionate dioxygenase-like ring-hydroxylating dioxygenase large terminal subunit
VCAVSLIDTRTLPWSWYVDPTVLQLEQDRIFRRYWHYVGRTDEIAAPESFHATRAGTIPVVLTRDADGVLRAFVNVCRHRGSIVCTGSGSRRTLQCPYHAWTYGLDGQLVKAPRSEREGGMELDELGLLPLQVGTWGPFVFVNADVDAPPLAEFLEDVPERIAAAGIDVSALRFLSRGESEYEANWKICAENFLECYHCAVAHPGFSAAIDVSPDAYGLDWSGNRMSQQGVPRPEPRTSYDLAGDVEQGQFHLLFPGTVINVMPGRPNLSIGPIVPLAPERTYRFLDYFVDPDVDEAWIEDMLAFDAQVSAEDRELVERVQTGVRSGAFDEGRLMPQSEQLVSHFQSLVVDALA